MTPEVVTIKLSKLKPDTKNARKHSERNIDEIVRSIEKFGQHRPFVVQRGTDKILVGNGMYEAMKKLGMKEGLVFYVDDDDEMAIRRALADNRTSELAEWDFDVLKDIAQELGPEPDVPGWSDEELEDLINAGGSSKEIIEDEAPELPENPVSKLGDIWALGRHRLMCGDSTLSEDVARLMDGQKADMVFTDPPYNVDYSAKNKFLNTISRGNRIQDDIEGDTDGNDERVGEALWKPAFENMYNMSADHCSIYVTMPQGGAHMMMMMMMCSAFWKVKHELVWVKNNHVLGRVDYLYKHEPIMFGWKKTHRFFGKGEFTKSIWEVDKPLKNDLHPTMKPIKLIANALMNSSEQDNVIIDLFGGSGSTLIACEQLNRKCFMMELDPKYCDVIINRWQELTGQKAIHAETGENNN